MLQAVGLLLVVVAPPIEIEAGTRTVSLDLLVRVGGVILATLALGSSRRTYPEGAPWSLTVPVELACVLVCILTVQAVAGELVIAVGGLPNGAVDTLGYNVMVGLIPIAYLLVVWFAASLSRRRADRRQASPSA